MESELKINMKMMDEEKNCEWKKAPSPFASISQTALSLGTTDWRGGGHHTATTAIIYIVERVAELHQSS